MPQGSSIFTDDELQLALGTAKSQLGRVKDATARVNLLERAPWVEAGRPHEEKGLCLVWLFLRVLFVGCNRNSTIWGVYQGS